MAIYADINEVKDGTQSYDKLQIDVYYNKDNYGRMERGIYLQLKPVKVSNFNGVDIISATLYGRNAKANGLTFLLEKVTRKNAKKEQLYHNAFEKHKGVIAEAYNRFDKNELTSLVFSIC